MSRVRISTAVVHAHRSRGWTALAALSLLLAACGSGPGPASQPLDAGQPAALGPDRHLAENGDRERMPPRDALGNPAAGGPRAAQPASPGPAPTPVTQPAPPPMRANDNPGEPMSADPLLDAGGYDPTPQDDAGESRNGSAGDTAVPGGSRG